MKYNLGIYFILLLFLVSCAVATPDAAPTLTITPTLTSTQTPVPTLTPTSTMMPPGIIAGMDVTQYGFDVGELVQKGDEIVYAETGEAAAKKDANGVMRFIYGPELIEKLHKVAKPGEMRNGKIYIDQKAWDHLDHVRSVIWHRYGIRDTYYEHLIIRKPSGYIDSYSLAWVVAKPGDNIGNNDPHDVTLYIQPLGYEYEGNERNDLSKLIQLELTNWINPTQY